MSDQYKPFIGTATAERIKRLRTRGAATVQLVQDPQPIVQLRRMNPGTGRFEDHGQPVHLIYILLVGKKDFAGNNVSESGQNTGLVTQRVFGELKAFAPIDLLEGDRFAFGDKTCEVKHVFPIRNKQVRAVIELVPAGTAVRP